MRSQVCLLKFSLLDLVSKLDEVLHNFFKHRFSLQRQHRGEVGQALEVSDVSGREELDLKVVL